MVNTTTYFTTHGETVNQIQTTDHNPLAVLLADPKQLQEIPVDTVKELWQMKKEADAIEASRQFNLAFNLVQSELEPVRKRGRNAHTGSFYALASDIEAMLDPILTRHGFSRSVSTDDSPQPDHVRFILILRHSGGHEERHRLDAPIDNIGIKNTPTKTRLHGLASSYTYCERHLICKVFGIQLIADDDGNSAAGINRNSDTIAKDEVTRLHNLLIEIGADHARFLKYFKIKKLEDLPSNKYQTAIRMCNQKRRVNNYENA